MRPTSRSRAAGVRGIAFDFRPELRACSAAANRLEPWDSAPEDAHGAICCVLRQPRRHRARRDRDRRQDLAPLLDRAAERSPLHLVSAWAADCRLVLGQVATEAKSNEITAVPKLLEMISLKGAIVTADALNCQRTIAAKVVEQGGAYVLALKGNQGTLHEDVKLL